jgi:hypothetical protein
MRSEAPVAAKGGFRVCFRTALPSGCRNSFPCDPRGNVDMDRLSDSSRRDYLFARIMARRDCLEPQVVPGGEGNGTV